MHKVEKITSPSNILETLIGIVDVFLPTQTPELEITFSNAALKVLRELTTKPNPRLSEAPFLGLGNEQDITEILALRGDFSRNSGLFQNGFIGSKMDKEELLALFEIADRQNRLGAVKVLGHTHPSGKLHTRGATFVVSPSESLLTPSMGHPKPLEGNSDLAFYKAFQEANSGLEIPFAAIAAITQNGPMVRVYEMGELSRLKKYRHIEKVPQKIIRLK